MKKKIVSLALFVAVMASSMTAFAATSPSAQNTASGAKASAPTSVVAASPSASGGAGMSSAEKSAMTYRSPEAIQAVANAYEMSYAEVANNSSSQPADIPKDDVYAISQGDKNFINGVATTQKVVIRRISKKKAAYKNAKMNLDGKKLVNYFDVFLPVADGNVVTTNFLIPKLKGTEPLIAQQFVDGEWQDIEIREIRKGHAIIDLTKSGSLRFVI